MGACVLCNKSAGLFNSLHKNCYQQYQASTDAVVALIATSLPNTEETSAAKLADKVMAEINRLPFVEEARQRTLVRALEKYADTYLRGEEVNRLAQPWCYFLTESSPNEKLFLDPHFLVQQKNLAALVSLRNGQLPECNMNENLVHLDEGEKLHWCFRQAYVQKRMLQPSNENWSVASQLIKNIMPKNKKVNAQPEVEYQDLWVTDQRLFFENDADQRAVCYSDIYSVSPTGQGVEIQPSRKDAMPYTIICEDGKLLYSLIHHVRSHC